LNNLRDAAWRELLRAESLMDSVKPESAAFAKDVDADDREEIVLRSGPVKLVVAPHRGGAIIEHDHMPKGFNALNIINRRREAYHEKLKHARFTEDNAKAHSIHDGILTKVRGLEKLLVYDRYQHGSGIEHFFDPATRLESIIKGDYRELSDLHAGEWDLEALSNNASLVLRKNALVEQLTNSVSVSATKQIDLLENGDVKVTHRIVNDSPDDLHCTFAIEWCANFLAPKTHDRFFEADGVRLKSPELESSGVVTGAGQLRIVDEYLGLALSFEAGGAEFWRMPIETISMSEGGFEKVYQGSIIFLVWELKLKPREEWQREVSVKFKTL
jgi:hypothetical protein